MIRSVHYSNLKSFGGRHHVALAPLTFIYGRNSAGKSTLIQSLLLLKQTIESSDPEKPALVIRGPLADLGSVPGIITSHDTKRELQLGLEIDTRRQYYTATAEESLSISVSFLWDEEARAVRQTGIDVGFDEDLVASYTRRRGPRAVESQVETPFRIGKSEAREHFLAWILKRASARPRLRLRENDVLELLDKPDTRKELHERATLASASLGILPYRPKFTLRHAADNAKDKKYQAILQEFELLWWDALSELRFELTDALDSLVYLGPLRQAPERFHILSGVRRRSVGREGEYTAEVLNQDQGLTSLVNTWLERLEIPYDLAAVDFEESDFAHTIGDVVVLALKDSRSGVLVSPGDVGFGISQLLPIVVQAFASRDATICIEQPEIHVHPRLQGHMADLFVDAALNGSGNQFLIETHSEHLMLRVQRRIRKGDLRPADVKVLYVDTDEDGEAQVLELRLDEGGRFLDDWPEGFFEERFEELFGD